MFFILFECIIFELWTEFPLLTSNKLEKYNSSVVRTIRLIIKCLWTLIKFRCTYLPYWRQILIHLIKSVKLFRNSNITIRITRSFKWTGDLLKWLAQFHNHTFLPSVWDSFLQLSCHHQNLQICCIYATYQITKSSNNYAEGEWTSFILLKILRVFQRENTWLNAVMWNVDSSYCYLVCIHNIWAICWIIIVMCYLIHNHSN